MRLHQKASPLPSCQNRLYRYREADMRLAIGEISSFYGIYKCPLQLSQNHNSSPILSWKNSYFLVRLTSQKRSLRLSYLTFRTRNGRVKWHAWKRKSHVQDFGWRACTKKHLEELDLEENVIQYYINTMLKVCFNKQDEKARIGLM